MAFTLEQHGRPRIAADAGTVALPGGIFDQPRERAFLARQSYRAFARRTLTMAEFGGWIGCLQAMPVDSAPLAKRLYPSAGSLYPVRVYLFVKAGAVEGLEAGAYVYDALAHRLARLGDAALSPETWASSTGRSPNCRARDLPGRPSSGDPPALRRLGARCVSARGRLYRSDARAGRPRAEYRQLRDRQRR